MSVLIKGMKMPTSCLKGGCPIDGFFCKLWEDKYWTSYEAEEGRHRDCPLIELPDHGDLIDRDDIENAALMIWVHNSNGDDAMEQTIEHIRHNIEAVIPAERSEDGGE